jgi:TrmH family RNA methyltransferase
MLSKSLISQIRLLHHKKYRDGQQLFIVEGIKSCLETLQSSFEVVHCFIIASDTALGDRAFEKNVKFQIISPKEMERISCLSTASEMLCVVKKMQYSLNELDNEKPLLILDTVKDPGNLGTIIRTADWFGFNQMLCSEDCVDFFNPKAIQASMGSFTRIKTVYTNIIEYLKTQTHRNIHGLYMNGNSIQKQQFKHNDIVIIGSESHGISKNITSYIHTKIEIPLYPHEGVAPESLNAAIASGIFMYAFRFGDKMMTKLQTK